MFFYGHASAAGINGEVSMLLFTKILLILALVCFLLAAAKIEPPRGSFMPLGLFFWLLSTLVTKV